MQIATDFLVQAGKLTSLSYYHIDNKKEKTQIKTPKITYIPLSSSNYM